jgi:TonB family protein
VGIVTLAALSALGQGTGDERKALRVGNGISAPRLKHKIEPEYSPLARADHMQGTVVIAIVVDEHGMPRDIHVISPLGFGLDEKAEEAIAKWRFEPGMKEGKPVPIMAHIEVNFRFPQTWFDERAEHRRTSFNVAIKDLSGTIAASQERAVKTVRDLADQKFPAAMYLAGLWEVKGDHQVPQDPDHGWRLIQQAADANYGPALYEVSIRSINAGGDSNDLQKQLQTLRDAAVLGSTQAQFYLGQDYETGFNVPKEPDRARRYYRLCAIKNEPMCQYHLGLLLLSKSERSEDDYMQGLAWLQLAGDRNVAPARASFDRELPQLTTAQAALIGTWKSQLTGMLSAH